MAELEYVLSELIAQNIGKDMGASESHTDPATKVMARLQAAGGDPEDQGAGVPDDETRAALKKNKVNLNQAMFLKLLKDGKTGQRINSGQAKSAARKLDGENGPPPGGGATDLGGEPAQAPPAEYREEPRGRNHLNGYTVR